MMHDGERIRCNDEEKYCLFFFGGGRYLDLLEGWYWKNKVFLVRSGFKLGLGLLVGNVVRAASLLARDRVKIQTLGICCQSV